MRFLGVRTAARRQHWVAGARHLKSVRGRARAFAADRHTGVFGLVVGGRAVDEQLRLDRGKGKVGRLNDVSVVKRDQVEVITVILPSSHKRHNRAAEKQNKMISTSSSSLIFYDLLYIYNSLLRSPGPSQPPTLRTLQTGCFDAVTMLHRYGGHEQQNRVAARHFYDLISTLLMCLCLRVVTACGRETAFRSQFRPQAEWQWFCGAGTMTGERRRRSSSSSSALIRGGERKSPAS